jgi:hypothetical protein
VRLIVWSRSSLNLASLPPGAESETTVPNWRDRLICPEYANCADRYSGERNRAAIAPRTNTPLSSWPTRAVVPVARPSAWRGCRATPDRKYRSFSIAGSAGREAQPLFGRSGRAASRPRSAVKVLGAPLEARRELQQLPPGDDEAALPGSLTKLARNLPVMLAVHSPPLKVLAMPGVRI